MADVGVSNGVTKIGVQTSASDEKPLTFQQIKNLIRNPASTDKDKSAQDKAIATEIRRRGIVFHPSDSILNLLRKLGAGPQTIQALNYIRKDLSADSNKSLNKQTKIIRILIADFQGPTTEGTSITNTIIDELKEATRSYPDIEVLALDEPITAKQGRQWAVEKGKERDANIVLWGWYNANQGQVLINAHFQVLHSFPSFLFTNEKQTLILPLADFFNFQIRLSKEMTYLTLLTVGIARLEAGDFDGAISLLSDAIAQTNIPEQMIESAHAYFFRGAARMMNVLANSGAGANQVLADLSEAIRLKPDLARAYSLRCSVKVTQKQYAHALDDCNKAIELEPNASIFYSTRANFYLSKGDTKHAIEDMNKAFELYESDQEDPLAYYYCAMLNVLKDDFEKALNCYNKLEEFDLPDILYYGIAISKGAIYLELEKYDLAASKLEAAIRMFPRSPYGYWFRGDVYYNRDQYSPAISDYSKAIDLGLNEPEVFNDRGLAFEENGQIDKAIEDYSKAVKLNPDYTLAFRNLGRMHILKKEFDKAINDFNQAIKVDPNDGLSYLHKGHAHRRKNELDQAFSDYSKAVDLIPKDSRPYYFRALLYEIRGESGRALEDYGMVTKLIPNYDDAYFRRGLLYEQQNNYEQAIKEYSQAIKANPKHVQAYLSRSKHYARKADYANAVSDINMVLQLTSDPQIRGQAEALLNTFQGKQIRH